MQSIRVTPLADVPLGTMTSPHRACFLQFRGEQPSGLGHNLPYQGHEDLAWHSGVHLRQHLQKRRGELQRRHLRLDADSDSYAQRSSRDTPLTSRATSLPAFTRYLSIAYTWRRSSRVRSSMRPSAWADVAQQVEQLTPNEIRSAVRVRSSALFFGLDERDNRNKCGSRFIIRGLLTPLTLHQLNGASPERVRDDPQISVSTPVEELKSLPSSIGPRAASPLVTHVVEASSSSRAYATACSKVMLRPSAHAAASSSASSRVRSDSR